MRWISTLSTISAMLLTSWACNAPVEQPDVPSPSFSKESFEKPGGIPAQEVPKTSKWYQAIQRVKLATVHIYIRQKKERFSLYLPGHPQWYPYCAGTIVALDGSVAYIVVANSLIGGMHVEIKAQLNSNRSYDCQLVGQDRGTDLALLKIEMDTPEAVKSLVQDPSYTPQLGEEILAMGSPYGRAFSVMTGIVSGSETSTNLTKSARNSFNAYIPINATFPDGSTGGPVVNQQGQWIGIVGASNVVELGLAIPASIVERVFKDLKQHGRVHRAMLGVCVENAYTAKRAIEAGLPKDLRGVIIYKVWENGAAAEAGLQPKDVITAVNSKPVENTAQFLEKTFTNDAQFLTITYYRGLSQHTVQIRPQLQEQQNWLQKLFGKRP